MQLYYLTSAEFARSNISKRRLKVSRFSALNDPFELMAMDLSDDAEQRAMQGFQNQMDKTKGVICFSSSWENPVLWGHYADKHRGMALGFEVHQDLILGCDYKNERFKLPRDPVTGRANPDEETIRRILSTKFVDWNYENEWRFFVELADATFESGLYFEGFSDQLRLNEVILGVKSQETEEEIQVLLSESSLVAKIIKGKVARDEFKIIG